MASPEVHRQAAREGPPRWRRRRNLVIVALSFSVLVQARAASSFVVLPRTTAALPSTAASSATTTNAKLDRLHSTTPDVPVASEATTSPRQRQHIRPPPFKRRNALSRTFPFPSPGVAAAWQRAVPPVDPLNILGVVGPIAGGGGTRRQRRRGVLGKDVRVVFDDPADGARALVEGCLDALGGGDSSKAGKKELFREPTQRHLAEVLEFYQDIVSSSSPPSDGLNGADNQPTTTTKKRCVARIVSSRGPVGTKCPRWHVDHVPVRLIMSLAGPGCVYLPESTEEGASVDREGRDGDSTHSEDGATATVQRGLVNRDALNHLDVDDTVQANRILVSDERCAAHAHACEAVLLVGREWEDDDDDAANGPSDGGGGVAAAAHRSPDLGALEGRVLLTVDVVPEGG